MDHSAASQTVLVVEDERSLSTAINKKLQLNGYNTLTASSVDEAIEYMKDRQPINVIWLDHYLFGDKNGIDFVTTVKAHDKWKQIPIYIVSNTASNDKVQSYIKLGVTKYYVKADHRLDEIIADIETYLKFESPAHE